MWLRYVIEVVALLVMVGGAGSIIYGVVKGSLALSRRTVQFLAIVFLFPLVLLLALEGAVGREAASALIGALAGYVLANVVKDEG